MSIDELLHPSAEFTESYYNTIEIGKKFAINSEIVFTGLARNISRQAFDSINRLFELSGTIFKDVNLVIFENDSTDSTKQILDSCQKIYKDKLYFHSEDNGGIQFSSAMNPSLARSSERTIPMAKYRNYCKNYIKDNLQYKDFTIVIDLDFTEISVNGLLHSFGILSSQQEIKAIAGNNFQLKNIFSMEHQNLWNYDSWAFRQNWWNDKFTEGGWFDPMLWFGFWTPLPGMPTIRVNSAFGGMAIYRMKEFLSADYDGYDCEHVCFHKNLYSNQDFIMVLNPAQVILS
jgi:hypothetical protein